MTDLSPAAQAIKDAYHESVLRFMPHADKGNGRPQMAAVLRAVADSVVGTRQTATSADYSAGANNEGIMIHSQLLEIAAELDPKPS
jgi:hypothetical protein